jgi:hypothetical protein
LIENVLFKKPLLKHVTFGVDVMQKVISPKRADYDNCSLLKSFTTNTNNKIKRINFGVGVKTGVA